MRHTAQRGDPIASVELIISRVTIGLQVTNFRKKIGEDVTQVFFTFKSDNKVYFSKMTLSIKEVEDIRLSVGLPDIDLTSYLH